MKRSISLVATTSSVVVAMILLAVAPGAADEAASITKLGWWTRNPASQAPADGFDVQHAPDGRASVAAIEVSAFDPLRSAVLILRESGGVGQDGAVLKVCPTPNVWSAGAAQAWREAPKAECEQASVDLVRNDTSATWAADVVSLLDDLDDGPVSLMVVSEAGTVPAFDVQFAAPELQAEADPDAGSASDFDFTSSDFGGSSGGSSGSGGSFGGGDFGDGSAGSASGSFGGTSFDPGASTFSPAGDVADDGGAPDETAADADSEGEEAAIPFPRSSAQAAAAGGGNRVLQAGFFLLLSTVAAVVAATGRRWVRDRQPEAIA